MGARVGMGLAPRLLGVAGALISTGYMVRGWSKTNDGQMVVREKIDELSSRILQAQTLLATVDRVECPLCADEVILTDCVQRCTKKQHCFHAACLQQWHARGQAAAAPKNRGGGRTMPTSQQQQQQQQVLCPECGSVLGPEEDMLRA